MFILAKFQLGASEFYTIGVVLILLVIIRVVFSRKREPAPYQPLESRRAGSSYDRENWEVQMHDTARQLMGELNTKIAVVEQLVRDAHAAAERLEKACDRAESLNQNSQ